LVQLADLGCNKQSPDEDASRKKSFYPPIVVLQQRFFDMPRYAEIVLLKNQASKYNNKILEKRLFKWGAHF
jgi:hypothetical protein